LPHDRDALTALLAPKTGSPFRPEEESCAIELLAAVLDPPEGNTYEARVLVDEGDRPLAYACFGRTPMTDASYDLYWLVTDGAHRGRGLGQRLLGELEGELRGRRARTVRIETSSLEGQGGALRFYEKAGYTMVGRIADFYRPGDDLLTLAKRLG
jgi:ribosomal protein S18 acetylase RimI-like enzyme